MKKTKLYLLVSLFSLVPFTANANSLMDVYELALKNDAQLKADEARYQADREAKALGRAGLLPQINARASLSRSDSESTNNLTNTSVKSDSDSQGWDITLNQPLFDMAAWYNYQRGSKLTELAEAQYSADQQNLIVRVATAYFDVLRAIDNLEATIAEEQALAKQLEQAKQRFAVGLTAITEMHEAQAAYDSAAAATLEARGLIGINFEALEVLTGRQETMVAPLSAKFPVIAPSPANRADWVEFALKNNYSLKAAKLQADSYLDSAKAAKAGHLPTLDLSLGYSESDSDGDEAGVDFDNTREGSSASLTLNVPIYTGGRTSASRRQAYANYNQFFELYNSTQRNVIQSTRSLHLTMDTDVARIQARKQAVISNQSALEATQSGYEVGTRNLVEVLLAQRNLYQARRSYSDALFDYVINSFRLREAAGMLTPADVQAIDQWLEDNALRNRNEYENY